MTSQPCVLLPRDEYASRLRNRPLEWRLKFGWWFVIVRGAITGLRRKS
jgi:hypothetical protein